MLCNGWADADYRARTARPISSGGSDRDCGHRSGMSALLRFDLASVGFKLVDVGLSRLASPLRSKAGRSRRSTRERVTRWTPRLNARARGLDPASSATQSTDRPRQDGPQFRASDAPTPADPTVGGRDLDNRRMNHAAGTACRVSRCECRRAGQSDNDREREQTLAGEIHDFLGLLNCPN